MIKIKPFVKFGYAPDVIFAMTENRVERVPIEYKALIEELQAGNLNPQKISDDDLEKLKYLDTLKLIYMSSELNSELVDVFSFNGWRESMIADQLRYVRVKIIDHHSDPSWFLEIKQALADFGFTIVDNNPTINILVVERLNQLDSSPLPALPVRIGNYMPSVGPFLCPTMTALDLKQHIDPGKRFFETESFLVPNHPLKKLAIQLVSAEIMNTLLQTGSYDTIKCIVEWNLTTLRRRLWPI